MRSKPKFKPGDVVEYMSNQGNLYFTRGQLYFVSEVSYSSIGDRRSQVLGFEACDKDWSVSHYAHDFLLVDSELARLVLGGKL